MSSLKLVTQPTKYSKHPFFQKKYVVDTNLLSKFILVLPTASFKNNKMKFLNISQYCFSI